MLEINYTKDSGRLARGEKITYYVFFLLMLVGATLDLLTDFEPKKMAAIVFIVAWIALTFLHEFGHALVSKLMGWEVKEFVVGYGKTIREFQYKETKV